MAAPTGPQPAFLTLPEPRDRLYQGLLRKARLLGLRHLLELGTSGPLAALAPTLSGLARRDSRTLLRMVGLHDVLTPLLCHRVGLCGLDQVVQGAVPTLLVALARSGVLTESLLWDHPLPRVIDPTRGDVVTHPDGPLDGLVAHPDGAEVRKGTSFYRLGQPPESFLVERHIHRLAPGLTLSTVDSNPLSMMEAHPDKAGNALSLGGRKLEDWTTALTHAARALAEFLPEWSTALPGAPLRLVPVGYEAERHLSASYREALGVVYLTLHPSRLTLAEAIVHEGQHTRLNTLMLLDAVLKNGTTTWTPSPVRPDLRPLNGVLLAAHAFVPVAVFHARLAAAQHPMALDPAFPMRRAAVLVGNDRGLRTCREKAHPTAAGARLLDALEQVHQWAVQQHPGGLAGAREMCADALPEGVPVNTPPC